MRFILSASQKYKTFPDFIFIFVYYIFNWKRVIGYFTSFLKKIILKYFQSQLLRKNCVEILFRLVLNVFFIGFFKWSKLNVLHATFETCIISNDLWLLYFLMNLLFSMVSLLKNFLLFFRCKFQFLCKKNNYIIMFSQNSRHI